MHIQRRFSVSCGPCWWHDLAASQLIARTFLKDESLLTKLKATEAKADAELIGMQREVARPRTYRFRIEPVQEK